VWQAGNKSSSYVRSGVYIKEQLGNRLRVSLHFV
jgi:hypothetical protein